MHELKALIAAALKIPADEVHDTTTMAETPEWDSLVHMEVVLSIEDHYKVNLEGDEIVRMLSVAAIADVLKLKGVIAE